MPSNFAVLAGARLLQVDPDNANAALASAATSTPRTQRAAVVGDSITFVLTDSNSAISVNGNAYLRTTFLGVVGITDLPLVSNASSRVAKATVQGGLNSGSNIEVSMMLDVTGSMCTTAGPCTSGTKMDGLKDAAKRTSSTLSSETTRATTLARGHRAVLDARPRRADKGEAP